MPADSDQLPLAASCSKSRCSGFALVIALSLMAFVLVLMLSMTTLVRVETSNSTMTKQRLLAGNNALLGLQVALGSLQMAAGPDQRVTANAAIGGDTMDVMKANYTVVWDVRDTLDSADGRRKNYTVDGTSSDSINGAPLAWLVSSADQANFSSTHTINADWPALVSEREFEIMVGGETQTVTVEAVRAEPISISATESASGEMAWWVGDEGVKAKFNLAESSYLRGSSTDSDERLGVSARFGIEALDGFSGLYPYADDDFIAGLRKAMSASQAGIVDGALETPSKNHFHEVSFHSRGLLTNTRDGGLKKDLTHYFEGGIGGPTGAILADDPSIEEATDRIRWEQLQDFYNLGDELSSDTITARSQTATTHGVYPLLTVLHLNFGFTMEDTWGAGVMPVLPEGRSYNVYSHMRPWFVLANPYNTKLVVSNYRIRFARDINNGQNPDFKISHGTKGSPDDLITTPLQDILSNMIFVVPTVTLEPGEALYYSLSPTDDTNYSYEFTNDTSVPSRGNYASYTGFDTDTPQQFVFHAYDDTGITSIRMEPATVIAGAETAGQTDGIEDGDPVARGGGVVTPSIKPMYGWLTNWDAGWTIRTYAGNSSTLETDEEILQDIGQFTIDSVASDNRYSTYQGFWDIDNLPTNLTEFTNFIPFKNDDGTDNHGVIYDGTLPGDMTPITFSLTYVMHSAVNKNSALDQNAQFMNSGFDGWATDFNLRSPRMASFKGDQKQPGTYDAIARANGFMWFYWMRGEWPTGGTVPPPFTLPQFEWGASNPMLNFDAAARVTEVRLFDIPRLDINTAQSAIASLGQLQHFNPGGWTVNVLNDADPVDRDMDTLGYSPSYAIGNSYAAPQVARHETFGIDSAGAATGGAKFSDLSYLLNEALFDGYFFSSLPQDSGVSIEYDKLPNKRLVPINEAIVDDELRTTGTDAAEHLLVDGAFNVNSTSVNAWYSLLNSFRSFDFGGKTSGQGFFPRSLNQSSEFVEGTVDGVANSGQEAWAGWRHIEDNLTNADQRKLYLLAEAIVEEVKARGPFVSMSDFVNRRLIENSNVNARHGLSGALQAAIDRTLNQDFSEAYDVDTTKMSSDYSTDSADNLSDEGVVDVEHLGNGPIQDLNGTILANASSAASMPGWVLQADLLQALAPALSVRSDTFIIRSYGNVSDPVTGKISVETYVEAVVQRIPDYVDSSYLASADPDLDPINSPTNKSQLGRKFSIVDIRFLDASSL